MPPLAEKKKKNSTIKTQKESINLEIPKQIKIALSSIILFVIFYAPFIRGLYFEEEQMPAEIIILSAFLAYFVSKLIYKQKFKLASPMEFASLFIVFAYIIAFFNAAFFRMAVAEWLKYLSYAAIFIVLSEFLYDKTMRRAAAWVAVAAGGLMCLTSFDSAGNSAFIGVLNSIFKFFGATEYFFSMFLSNRLYSSLQYPNAFAAYLMGVFLITTGLVMDSEKKWQKAVAAGIGALLLCGFVYTLSRGAYIVFPFALLLFFLVLPVNRKVTGALAILSQGFPALIAVLGIARDMNLPQGNKPMMWMMVIFAMAGAAVLSLVIGKISNVFEKISWKVYISIAGAVVAVGLTLVIVAFNYTLPVRITNPVDSTVNATATKTVELSKGSYRLAFDAKQNNGEAIEGNDLKVNITSAREKDILLNITNLSASNEIKLNKAENESGVDFDLPEDTRVVYITFENLRADSTLEIGNVKILDRKSSEVVSKIPMKYALIPEFISSKFEALGFARSALERKIFYKDGLKLLAEAMPVGFGGGAWQVKYFKNQSYLYWTTQAHNYLLQLGIESGILGFMGLLLLVAALIYCASILILSKATVGEEGLIWGAFAGAFGMLAHSFMDFDFSLTAVFMLFWLLLSIFNSAYKEKKDASAFHLLKFKSKVESFLQRMKIPSIAFITVIFIGLALIISMRQGAALFKEGAKYATTDVSKAYKLTMEAAKWDPAMPSYTFDAIRYMLDRGNSTQEDVDKALSLLDSSKDDCKSSPDMLALLGSQYISLNQVDKGLSYIYEAAHYRPMRAEDWGQVIAGYFNMAIYNFGLKNDTKALELVDKGIAVSEEASKYSKISLMPFIMTNETITILGKLQYIKDNYKKGMELKLDSVAFYSLPWLDVNGDGTSDQWRESTPDVSMKTIDNTVFLTNSKAGTWGNAQTMPLPLKTQSGYKISLKLHGKDQPKSIPFIIAGVSESNSGLLLNGDEYTAFIKTPKVVNTATSIFRLGIMGQYKIENIEIIEDKEG